MAAIGLTAVGIPVRADHQERPAVPLRFHHLHYRVPDPAAAMRDASGRLNGTRVILQGLGVGVRVGREHVLFDREGHEAEARAAATARMSPEEAYAEAAAWLRGRNAVALPPHPPAILNGIRLSDGAFDHIAFAADDLEAAAAAIDEPPSGAAAESVRYRLPSGLMVEIVRDTGRPDSHWCPMHPDVRGPGDAKCPACGMDLVAIPPPRLGEYGLDIGVTPRGGGGASELRFVVRDPETAESVSTFVEVHEKLFHLFVVKRDLTGFLHVHPAQQDDGSFVLAQDLEGGEYLLIADFLPAGGTPQMVQRAIVTPGYAGRLFAPPPEIGPTPRAQIADGLRVALDASSPVALRPSALRFAVSDAATGAPVTDIEPYLGASGHLLLVNRELTTAIHAHPEGPVSSGPEIAFDATLPDAGVYKLWLQFQRNGQVVTVPFVIDVPRQ